METPPSNLPPVPQSLRDLCARQLQAKSPTLSSAKLNMKRLATHLQAMQLMMLDRPSPRRLPTGPASTNSSEWSRLIGDYDKALALLRVAYVDYNKARDAVKALPTTPEGQDYYVFKLPLVKQIGRASCRERV